MFHLRSGTEFLCVCCSDIYSGTELLHATCSTKAVTENYIWMQDCKLYLFIRRKPTMCIDWF